MRNCSATQIFQFISNDSLVFPFFLFSPLFGHYTSTYTYINIYCILEHEEYTRRRGFIGWQSISFTRWLSSVTTKNWHVCHMGYICTTDRGERGWVNLIIKVRVERKAKKNRRASLRFEQLFHIPPVSFVCSRVSTYPLSLFSCALPSF